MAGIWNNSPCWSVTLIFLTYVYMCWGCTPPDGVYKPKGIAEKLFYSDIFAYGKVKDIYRGGYMYDTMYTVNFEIYCTFKGDPLPQFVNITRAGESHEPGLCLSNQFKKGEVYFVYLNKNAKELTPSYNEDGNITDELVQEVPIYCDLTISPPVDLKGDPEVVCPEPYPDYDECIKHTTTTAMPEPSVVVKTMAPKGKDDTMPADGTPVGGETGQAVSQEENSSGRVLMSLGVTALCLVLAVF